MLSSPSARAKPVAATSANAAVAANNLEFMAGLLFLGCGVFCLLRAKGV
jgi:hypothetical protein